MSSTAAHAAPKERIRGGWRVPPAGHVLTALVVVLVLVPLIAVLRHVVSPADGV